MDENLEKVIQNCNAAFYEFGKAVYEAARELGERMREAMSHTDELNAALESFLEAAEKVKVQIKARDEERKKWHRVSSVRVPVFLYDKREKVHRCRNSC